MTLLEGPNSQQMEAIRDELGEDSDRLQNNIQLLQKWMACQVYLPQDYDNNLLYTFLRGCKHNLDRTKKKLEMYFIARTKVPELFGDREPTEELMEKYLKIIKLAPLPKLTPDGCRITIHKIMYPHGVDCNIKELLRCIFMTADIRVAQETAISGDVFIYDLENLKVGHLVKYITPLLKKALLAAHEAYPQRLKQVHIVNPPPFLDKILSIIKSFLKEKVKNRFIVHHSVDDLLKHFASDLLPIEYGGTSENFDNLVNNWTDYVINHKKWFQLQDNVKAIEPFPQNDSYSQFDDVIGLDGSFRKLYID